MHIRGAQGFVPGFMNYELTSQAVTHAQAVCATKIALDDMGTLNNDIVTNLGALLNSMKLEVYNPLVDDGGDDSITITNMLKTADCMDPRARSRPTAHSRHGAAPCSSLCYPRTSRLLRPCRSL